MMDNWLDNAAHMHVIGANGGANGKVENPDQRIADDCDSYVWRQVDVIVSFVESTVELYFFLPLLYKLSPPIYPVEGWLCYASVGYCLVYTGMVALLGKDISTLQYAYQRTEANFRFSLIAVRDFSEGVAMLRSEPAEERFLDHYFAQIRGIFWRLSFLNRRLDFAMGIFGTIEDILPIMLLAPSYFSGHISIGVMIQVRHALSEVLGSFQWFANSYYGLAMLTATSQRLETLEDLAEARRNMMSDLASRPRLGYLGAEDLSFDTATGQTLVSGATFRIDEKWALLTGPEGSGKDRKSVV